MCISAVALKEGHQTFLCEINNEDPFKKIEEIKPDIIAYSSSTGESKHYIRLDKEIKAKHPGIFSIMGGPHPTFFPELINDTTFDAIFTGESDGAFSDFLQAYCAGKPLEGIPNVITKKSTPRNLRNLVEDLDSLPIPDYGLMYDNTPMGKSPLKSFMVSRGCPYKCTYCFNPTWNKMYEGKGKIVRRMSVDKAIENIVKVRERWPLSTVKFYDDIFSYRADEWLEEFAKKYKKEINLPYFILTRCDLLTEDMVKLLKASGCRTISMSIEAGNPDVRNNLLKRNMSSEDIIRAHRLCDKYGIYTFTNCIIGLPNTKIEQDIESIDICIKSRVSWSEFLIFYPYPGTVLGDQTINMGLYTPDYEKMHTSYMYRSELNCFTDKEKNAQQNIAELGAVATTLPFLRNLIVKRLIWLKHNRFYIFMYWLVKMYIIRNKIYVTKTTFKESLRIYWRSLRQEVFRHTPEKVKTAAK
ncbi:MAG: hypothetical protein A2297_05370 [Elusimicrobia bacterium RIFOXYB2_FULL_48_7]|nr:MAG: hypothetical protein A2297_05370 [Elusimicrobia bacterium RIFOXYB2_FULL_48_7]